MAALKILKFIDYESNEYDIPEKYCFTWTPVQEYRELGLDNEQDAPPLNIMKGNKKFVDHLLKWYKHTDPSHYTNDPPKIGETFKDVAPLVIEPVKDVNPFDDTLFTKKFDIDFDEVEEEDQLVIARMVKYTNANFQDDWNKAWAREISENKKEFFSFLEFLCYIGCRIPLCIATLELNSLIDLANERGYSKEFIRGHLMNEDDDTWRNDIPVKMETESDSESDEEEDDEDEDEDE